MPKFSDGQVVRIKEGVVDPMQEAVVPGAEYRVEGLWKELTGQSWMTSNGNPAAMQYAIRSAHNGLPLDDNVYYGKIGFLGHLVHESELEA